MSAKRLRHRTFLGTGNNGGTASFTVPAGVYTIWVWGYGGGGGGGGGRGGALSNTTFGAPGGGGGGGSQCPPEPIPFDVLPGDTVQVTVGAGGSTGAGGSGNAGEGAYGGNGGDSYVEINGTRKITFRGAHGGVGGGSNSTTWPATDNPGGGGPIAPDTVDGGDTSNNSPAFAFTDHAWGVLAPGCGGWGCSNITGSPTTAFWGMRNFVQKGTNNGTTGTRSSGGGNGSAGGGGQGGGGGGGGACGPGGVGGDGGSGGSGGFSAGQNGNYAGRTGTPNNTGAGGGGGGGGAYSSLAGGTGGQGGSGKVVVSYIH